MTFFRRSTPSSDSKRVRMLSPRQPMPRDWSGRFRLATRLARKVPYVSLGAIWILFLAGGLVRYTVSTPYFQIDDVWIEGEQRLSEPQLRAYVKEKAEVEEGNSLLSISTSKIEQTLSVIPEVDKVEAERIWPNQLRIAITEHVPAGIVVLNTGSYVFDANGLVFSKTGSKPSPRCVPRSSPVSKKQRCSLAARCHPRLSPRLKTMRTLSGRPPPM